MAYSVQYVRVILVAAAVVALATGFAFAGPI
jgi:hypothetical protein